MGASKKKIAKTGFVFKKILFLQFNINQSKALTI